MAEALALAEETHELSERDGLLSVQAEAANRLGNLWQHAGQVRDRALGWHERALRLYRKIGHRLGEGNALGNLGLAYAALGDARKAIEFNEQCLVVHREIGDRRGEGNALGNLGNAYAALGDARKAIEFYEQCLVVHREIGNRRGEGKTLGNLGNAYADLGELDQALLLHRGALGRAIADQDTGDFPLSVARLGTTHIWRGDRSVAVALLLLPL